MSDPHGWVRDDLFESFQNTGSAAGDAAAQRDIVKEIEFRYGRGPGANIQYQIDFQQYHARKNSYTFRAAPQVKTPPARAARKLDDSLLTAKKPSADIDKKQQVATSGETIPIVFGKRVDGIGGVWVQPSMLKSGTKSFVGSFLYAISQGRIIGSPLKYRTWVGTQSLAFLPDQSIALYHDYADAAEIAAAPDTCPIGGGTLFCGVETYSYLSQLSKAEVDFTYTYSYNPYNYYTTRTITRG